MSEQVAGPLEAARLAAADARAAQARADSATLRRDDAIRAALEAGVRVHLIRDATELSRERIYQIRDGRR